MAVVVKGGAQFVWGGGAPLIGYIRVFGGLFFSSKCSNNLSNRLHRLKWYNNTSAETSPMLGSVHNNNKAGLGWRLLYIFISFLPLLFSGGGDRGGLVQM
jgi:hypothetical protein